MTSPFVRGGGVLAAMALAGCAALVPKPPQPAMSLPSAPVESGKCQVAASQSNPLVTEWPASEKSNLEVGLREGGVVVAYSGCSMRLLPRCTARGVYMWTRTTTATDMIDINNEDDLYAKLPLGAVSLEGELKRSGRLAMQTTVTGQLRLSGANLAKVPTTGDCAGATHVVGALSVGAFQLRAGGGYQAGASASARIVSAGGGRKHEEELLRQAGAADRCSESTDQMPHADCRSPIQMFLWALPKPGPEAAAPPAGLIKVEFIVPGAEAPWQVVSDDEVLCDTPCSKYVHPAQHLMMQERSSSMFSRNRVQVPRLRDHVARAPLVVNAKPMSRGGLAGGATMGAFGGMALMTGLVLAPLGCLADQSPNMCTAGLITLPIGAVLMGTGLWLAISSAARATVEPSAGDSP